MRRSEAMGGKGGQTFITHLASEMYDIYFA